MMAHSDSGKDLFLSSCTPTKEIREKLNMASEKEVPPKITPFSGVLSKGKIVVRPIAFKPVGMPGNSRMNNAGERYGSTPILARPGSHLTLYGSSNDLRHMYSYNNYSLDRKSLSSVSPSPMGGLSSLTSLPPTNIQSCDSLNRKSPSISSHSKKSTSFRMLSQSDAEDDLTPSPSDSGVAELEAALRERDSEVVYLRQTMEHNEQAIIRVYQEKERAWERDRRRMKTVHENRLRAFEQKILKLEQMLLMQSYQVQQKQNEMQCEAADLRQELDVLRGRLEETEWSLCQKTGESSLLKAQLKEAHTELNSKNQELLKCRNRTSELQREIDGIGKNSGDAVKRIDDLLKANQKLTEDLNKAKKLREQDAEEIEAMKVEVGTLRQEIVDVCQVLKEEQDEKERVIKELNKVKDDKIDISRTTDDAKHFQRELDKLKNQLLTERTDFEQERVTWAQEKEKVLRYQRQLQLNYVQMFRKTRNLEAEIENLTAELEELNKQREKGINRKQSNDMMGQIEISPTIEL